MVSKQDVTVDLSRLLRNDPQSTGEVEASGRFVPPEPLPKGDYRLEQPLDYHLVIRSTGEDGELLLTGEVSGTVLMPCRRCLEPVEASWKSDLLYPLEFVPGTAELTMRLDDEDDEVLEFGQPEVDFAVFLTEVFLVEQPLTVAHPDGHPDCEDLVREYGQDAGQAEQASESPFAVLKDFDVESTEE